MKEKTCVAWFSSNVFLDNVRNKRNCETLSFSFFTFKPDGNEHSFKFVIWSNGICHNKEYSYKQAAFERAFSVQ